MLILYKGEVKQPDGRQAQNSEILAYFQSVKVQQNTEETEALKNIYFYFPS